MQIKDLKVKRVVKILGKDQWEIDLAENGISPYRKNWKKQGIAPGFHFVTCTELFGGQVFQILGVEAFATGEGYKHTGVGLLVTNTKTKI